MTEELSTVFVIDDDPSVRGTLTDLFESVGLRVKAFASARDFRRERRPDTPSCLVLDVRLLGKSGLDFQRELDEANIRLPFIFLTGAGGFSRGPCRIWGSASSRSRATSCRTLLKSLDC